MKHLAAGWLTVGLFLFFGDSLLSKSNLDSIPIGGLLFIWILGVILWCAFGVIVAADHLAEMLGEPYGTLILTFSIVAIEVMLISTVMLGCLASLMITMAAGKRVDHAWKLVRRAAGHRQERGALERIFATSVGVAAVIFTFWFLIIQGPGPTFAPSN